MNNQPLEWRLISLACTLCVELDFHYFINLSYYKQNIFLILINEFNWTNTVLIIWIIVSKIATEVDSVSRHVRVETKVKLSVSSFGDVDSNEMITLFV